MPPMSRIVPIQDENNVNNDTVGQEAANIVTDPSNRTLALWSDVASGIDKSQTVVWKNAVDSLNEASRYLHTSEDARRFIENYMKPVISILLEQQPQKTGQFEKQCVEDSLKLAVIIVADDIKVKATNTQTTGDCSVLEVLAMIFNRKKPYYKGSRTNWNNTLTGLPEVRLQMIQKFRNLGGISSLATYLESRCKTPNFPSLDLLHLLLNGACEAVPINVSNNIDQATKKNIEDEVLALAKIVMDYMESATEEILKKQSHESLSTIRWDLQRIFDRISITRRKEAYVFYEFYRNFALKLISSQSLPLKLFGWDTVTDLIEYSTELRPPPRAYLVSGAGTSFVNGRYEYVGALTEDGFVKPNTDVRYEQEVSSEDGTIKKLTLFRCTMRSQQKWWFLSEADEEQPGTDKDVDYYQHKSKKSEESEPPASGWTTCRNAGIDPPPLLEPLGLMVPDGEEFNTMEHQLAKWAIQNGTIELVLGNSIHREIVARSIPLIKFLAYMCTRDKCDASFDSAAKRNAYCLQASHLELAWKTCTSKLDSAVSTEIYQLLVSILPSLPNSLAIHLLTSIQASLFYISDERNYIFEVGEFCSALANLNPSETVTHNQTSSFLHTDVVAEIVKLLWAVLTHPDALSLKCYEKLKGYVINEIRVEPFGSGQRVIFLESCKKALHANTIAASLDESLASRMVYLTQLILEACPADQAVNIIMENDAELAKLVFDELTAYIRRRIEVQMPQQSKKPALSIAVDIHHTTTLSGRLSTLRYVYGLCSRVNMTTQQLDILWNLCTSPANRESIMIFLAKAAHSDSVQNDVNEAFATDGGNASYQTNPGPQVLQKQSLSAAFIEDVRVYAFQKLFCSSDVDWEKLGFNAYQSFQMLFKSLNKSVRTSLTCNGSALDALWKICLSAGDDGVATHAMRDLMLVYTNITAIRNHSSNSNEAWKLKVDHDVVDDQNENFAERLLLYFERIKHELQQGNIHSKRSAERCVRILNVAVGHSAWTTKNTTYDYSGLLSSLVNFASMEDIILKVPHGLRGQGSYYTISISVKRINSHNSAVMNSNAKIPLIDFFSLKVHPLEQLQTLKSKISEFCQYPVELVKLISVNGRQTLNSEADNAFAANVGICDGCEVTVLLASNPLPENRHGQNGRSDERKSRLDLGDLFGSGGTEGPSDQLLDILLDVLEALPVGYSRAQRIVEVETQHLFWELLLSVPSNAGLVLKVRSVAGTDIDADMNAMAIDRQRKDQEWGMLLDVKNYQRSVYILQIIDSFLNPAVEFLEHIQSVENRNALQSGVERDAVSFRLGLVESGGFDAILHFFTQTSSPNMKHGYNYRMGNECALRILKCCFFGIDNNTAFTNDESMTMSPLDESGQVLMSSLNDADLFLQSLASAVVDDEGLSDDGILNVLQIIQNLLLFDSARSTLFSSLPRDISKKIIITLLLWEGPSNPVTSKIGTSGRIRKTTEELILSTPSIAELTVPWLIEAIDSVNVLRQGSYEFFSVIIRLIVGADDSDGTRFMPSLNQMKTMSRGVCAKLAAHPSPNEDSSDIICTDVLCGCLKIMKALIDNGNASLLVDGVDLLVKSTNVQPWSMGVLTSKTRDVHDDTLINLAGVIFDVFLSEGDSPSSSAICCDTISRQLGFELVTSCIEACRTENGFLAIASKISDVISTVSISQRHQWGTSINQDDRVTSRNTSVTSKYSGLKNQGCTCYMNSVLQQLFMMPELRDKLCSATLPFKLRSSGRSRNENGVDLVGKCLSLLWDNGQSYEAIVESYNPIVDMHTIRYTTLQLPGSNQPEDNIGLPQELPQEFVLSEGRPGKETGAYEILQSNENESSRLSEAKSSEDNLMGERPKSGLDETNDEASYRHLLEEVQRTFVHLAEGARGRVFDPRALVEASSCLKLEFDIWQQNDASEFAMKLLDRLEVPLKRWSPNEFKYLEQTFRLKQTKQKICKECGLETNREENLMNIDCQIRGKSDIHEALSTMCEIEYMEGDNKVFCDSCKKNCDTILRTAISALPDVLILSLKRFDLDYTTFETVKLNSMCAFDQILNMKKYTLEGVESLERSSSVKSNGSDDVMDTGEGNQHPYDSLCDEDYTYKLAGVLVHHGVAQGGHYYSFIRDRSSDEGDDKWYRFDDEDVTPFDPSMIETECFGGKVRKETKWPNGQVQMVETEQLANALMLFYEKVKPNKNMNSDMQTNQPPNLHPGDLNLTTGIDVFKADVKRSISTLRSHSFLTDLQFKHFLKALLDKVVMINTKSNIKIKEDSTWQLSILELCMSYFFDVILHCTDKELIDDWSSSLSASLVSFSDGAKWFTHELARRTSGVIGNWLRIFSYECPDTNSRTAAMQVICNGMQCCLGYTSEKHLLQQWSQAWADQARLICSESPRPFPTALGDSWRHLEDVSLLQSGESSCVGIILSHISLLLEFAPRQWVYNADVCSFLKNLCSANEDNNVVIRQAMIESQIPARILALILREKSPRSLRLSFPGASISTEMAEALAKPETQSVSHLLPIGASNLGMNHSTNLQSPSPSDHIGHVEYLAAVMGIDDIQSANLIYETGSYVKGRCVVALTKLAQEAFIDIFNDNAPEDKLMGHRDIFNFMKQCGLDPSNIPQQRITNILNRYGNDAKLLTLEGFLAYYRDICQSDELQVRIDLHNLGYRPNLSRFPAESLFYTINGRKIPYDRSESVAIDVALKMKTERVLQLGARFESGIASFHFHVEAYHASNYLSSYLLAWSCYNQNTTALMTDTLKALYHAQPGWSGNELSQACIAILKVLCSIPDGKQQERISQLMQNTDQVGPHSELKCGLLFIAKELSLSRPSQHYNSLLFERYIDALREFQKLRHVAMWMSENRPLCGWMENWLRSDSMPHPLHQSSGEYNASRRDMGSIHLGSMDHHRHSDSDINNGLNYSDEDDDESSYEAHDHDIQGKVIVSGAGLDCVNGIYVHKNSLDGVKKFEKTGVWNGREEMFHLFRCRLSDKTRRWYISIVPRNIQPGSNKDIDFYCAKALDEPNEVPDKLVWTTAKENGVDPPPTVTWQVDQNDGTNSEDPIYNSEGCPTLVDKDDDVDF